MVAGMRRFADNRDVLVKLHIFNVIYTNLFFFFFFSCFFFFFAFFCFLPVSLFFS